VKKVDRHLLVRLERDEDIRYRLRARHGPATDRRDNVAGLDSGEVSGAPALYRRNQCPLPTSIADLGTQGCPAGIGNRASSSGFD